MPRESLWQVVKSLNAEGRLALFVGAGVSIGCGLPSWKTLVERVLNEAWKEEPHFASHLIGERNILATRFARNKIGSHFNRIVHQCLYRDEVAVSRCVQAIARSGVKHICSLNFDDLLEDALLADGKLPNASDAEDISVSRHEDVTVYHPHGVLPRFFNGAELDSSKIVFSEDDYHNLYSDAYSSANIAQLALLTGYSVLFVGLSMQDPSLRRLIDIARTRGFRRQHFVVFRDPTIGCMGEELRHQKLMRRIVELDMKGLGVTPWFVDSHDKVAEILEAVAVERVSRRRGPH